MPSDAFTSALTPLLNDVADLVGAHQTGRVGEPGAPGRQWNLAGLNRAIVVIAVSAWEAYIENVVVEATDAIRPPAGPLGSWPALRATVGSARGRFHTPNSENVQSFVRDALGLADVTVGWRWQRTTSLQARTRLSRLLTLMHQIAHGVVPRPTVNHPYASRAAPFVRRLAECTDAVIRDHLQHVLGVLVNW